MDGQCNLTTWLLGGGIEGPEQDNGGRRDDDEQPFYDADEDLSEDDLEAEGEEQVDNIGEVTLDVLPRGKVWQVRACHMISYHHTMHLLDPLAFAVSIGP